MPKRILLPSQTIQSTPTVPVNYDFINPEDTPAHKELHTYSYSVGTDRLYVHLDSLPFSGNTNIEKNPASSDMYVHPATTDSVLRIVLYTSSEVYWTLENESDYYLVFAIQWAGHSVQNKMLPPHGAYSTLQKIKGYHDLYLSYILKQGGTRKQFAPQITAYPLVFQPFNESTSQIYVYKRDITHQLKHPSISIGLFASSSGTKTCIIEIDKIGVPTYAGRGVTGPDTVFLELDTIDKWHKIPIVCSTTGWYVEHIKWVNKTDYYLCVYVEEEGTFNIIPPNDNITQNFVTPTNYFTTRIYYILNGGGCLPTKNLSPRRFLKWEK